jgi:hypothetical protein
MHNRSLAAALLSLSTSRQRAVEIEGDLIEEREHRGCFWFAVQVIGTAFALFGETFKEAPLRITLLSVVTTSVWVVACRLLDYAFFAPDALVPAPLLGLFAVLASAFLSGFGLGYLAPNLGIRSTVLTAILLVILFFVTRASAESAQFMADLNVGIGVAVLNASLAFLLMLAGLAFSLVIFLAPLITGSVYGHNRSTGA